MDGGSKKMVTYGRWLWTPLLMSFIRDNTKWSHYLHQFTQHYVMMAYYKSLMVVTIVGSPTSERPKAHPSSKGISLHGHKVFIKARHVPSWHIDQT